MMATYTRTTELRHVKPNDLYKLSVILDEDKCWLKLLEMIPKRMDTGAFMLAEAAMEGGGGGLKYLEEQLKINGPKYNSDHIHLLENAVQDSKETRLIPSILFEEWSTSGRKHERPTVAVLMQILVGAELYRGADFVAQNLLNEPPPPRPKSGPGTKIDISLPSEVFQELEEMAFDSKFYPTTGALNFPVHNSTNDNNKDYYEKYMGRHIHGNKSITNQSDEDGGNPGSQPPSQQTSVRAAAVVGVRREKPSPSQQQPQQRTVINDDTFSISENGTGSTTGAADQQLQQLQELSMIPESRREEIVSCEEHHLPKLSALLHLKKSIYTKEEESSSESSSAGENNREGTATPLIQITLTSPLTPPPPPSSTDPVALISSSTKKNENRVSVQRKTPEELVSQTPDITSDDTGLTNLSMSDIEITLPKLSIFGCRLESEHRPSGADAGQEVINSGTPPSPPPPPHNHHHHRESDLINLDSSPIQSVNKSVNSSSSTSRYYSDGYFELTDIPTNHKAGAALMKPELEIIQCCTSEEEEEQQQQQQLAEIDNDNNSDNEDEDDDDGEDSLPNLSIFQDLSYNNNDSSLTTVTGTSGDDSFDLSLNDCSSNSLENVPINSMATFTTKP